MTERAERAASAPRLYGFMLVDYSDAEFNPLTATGAAIRPDKRAVSVLAVSEDWKAHVPLRGRGLSPPGWGKPRRPADTQKGDI